MGTLENRTRRAITCELHYGAGREKRHLFPRKTRDRDGNDRRTDVRLVLPGSITVLGGGSIEIDDRIASSPAVAKRIAERAFKFTPSPAEDSPSSATGSAVVAGDAAASVASVADAAPIAEAALAAEPLAEAPVADVPPVLSVPEATPSRKSGRGSRDGA